MATTSTLDHHTERWSSEPPLIGRSSEIDALEQLVDGLGFGSSTLILRGEAGSRKTALLDYGFRIAEEAGVLAIRATGTRLEKSIPWAAFDQLIRRHTDCLARLVPDEFEVLSAEIDRRLRQRDDLLPIGRALLDTLESASEMTPLGIIVDDLQWFDTESARLLQFIARRLSAVKVILLGATQTGDRDFTRQSDLQIREVGPLREEYADELIRRHHSTLSARERAGAVAKACGNPLALIKLRCPPPPAAVGREGRSISLPMLRLILLPK
jgi:hypothetical protein